MQGSPLSPKLFNFILDSVIKKSKFLRALAEKHLLAMYADDLFIQVKDGESAANSIRELELMARDNLLINKKKTKTMTLNPTINKSRKIVELKL